MGQGVNKVIIIGNLGQDPEMHYTPSGTVFAEISVATSISWKDKNTGQPKKHTEWTRVAFSGRLAEVVGEYLHKGSKVYCEGRLHTSSWLDAQGNKQYKTVVRCSEMQMLDNKDTPSADAVSNLNQQPNQQARPNQNQGPAHANNSTQSQPNLSAIETGFGGGAFSSFDDDIPFAPVRYAEGG